MARLIKVFFLFLFVFRVLFRLLVHIDVFVLGKLAHNLFDTSFHHSEILLRVDRFSLRFSLHILYFLYRTVLARLAFETAIYAGSGLRRFVKHCRELDFDVVVVELFAHHGHGLGGVIDSKVLPAIGAESGKVKTK